MKIDKKFKIDETNLQVKVEAGMLITDLNQLLAQNNMSLSV